jgi:signal peptidase II
MKSLIKRFILLFSILVICIIFDQVTKYIALNFLYGKPAISFFFDTFRLTYAENTGAFLSFGANFPYPLNWILFIFLPVLFLIGLVLYLIFKNDLPSIEWFALSIIAGGGISNLMDRILRNHSVIDFMNIGIGPIRTGIFNFADLYITTGFVILLITGFMSKNKRSSNSSK